MQDAHNANAVCVYAVDDDMGANQVRLVRWRQIIAAKTKFRCVADRLQRIVNLVAVNQKLTFPPGFTGVAQDIDKILSRLSGKA